MSASTSPAACVRCDEALPVDARFCPRCGTPVLPADGGLAPERPPSVHHVERRPLGLSPVPFLGGLALALLAFSIVMMAGADWVIGIVLLLLSALLAALFLTGLRQEPESASARFLRRMHGRIGGSVGFAMSAGRTWLAAIGEVVRIRLRRARLRRELRNRLAPLGEAVHRDDEANASLLKARTAELQRELERAQRRETAVLGAAREELQRARVPVQSTEVMSVVTEDEQTE